MYFLLSQHMFSLFELLLQMQLGNKQKNTQMPHHFQNHEFIKNQSHALIVNCHILQPASETGI